MLTGPLYDCIHGTKAETTEEHPQDRCPRRVGGFEFFLHPITDPIGVLTQLSSLGNPDHLDCVVRAGELGCRDWGLLRV